MRVDWAISAVVHAGLLAWGMVSFSVKPFEAPPEAVPVDIVSATELSKMTAGTKQAKPAEKPKPLVEKVAEKKPAEDVTPKITEKNEIKEAKAEPPPPMPEPRPKPPQPPQPPQAKPEPKVDEIAEALKKDNAKRREEARKEQKQAEKPQPKKPDQPAFDPSQIAALLDKRAPQRHAAAGDTIHNTASLGLPSATSAQLSQSEIDALRARLAQLWNPPAGAKSEDELVVRVRFQLRRDGRLAGPPQVLNSGSGVLFQTARDSAIRALFRGQPFDMLRQETYEQWKDIEINFDPREMMRG